MKFDIITIFPEIFESYLKQALISRALEKKLVSFQAHDLRDWAEDERRTVDDRPFGGGLGMVIKAEPILKAVLEIKNPKMKSKTILLGPRGKQFNQEMAYQFSKLDQLIIISGRYDGVDQRVIEHIADSEVSIGNYVLMGGEIPAMAIFEATARLVPGVVGDDKETFLSQKTEKNNGEISGMIESCQYTRPEVLILEEELLKKYGEVELKNRKVKDLVGSQWTVPKDLVSGDHKKIEDWKKKNSQSIWN
jgi:tRNA (guanine37-N1)-methyltransferase